MNYIQQFKEIASKADDNHLMNLIYRYRGYVKKSQDQFEIVILTILEDEKEMREIERDNRNFPASMTEIVKNRRSYKWN